MKITIETEDLAKKLRYTRLHFFRVGEDNQRYCFDIAVMAVAQTIFQEEHGVGPQMDFLNKIGYLQ